MFYVQPQKSYVVDQVLAWTPQQMVAGTWGLSR